MRHRGAVLIRRATEDDWPLVQHVRLRALHEDADVFGSSAGREERFTETHWRRRLRSSTTWLALDDDDTGRGLVTMILEPASPPDDRHVVSLWVAPESRRRGVGWSLLEVVRDGAAADGARTLSLWVTDDNVAAADLYVRFGFTRSGERQPLVRDPSRHEERYVLRLRLPPDPP